ncbi:MAG: enoyl-CoA hydratase/isomerase family protein [Microbacterium ginsengisoli]|jgi:2-(1,2-epoxy-1,2-dihydrophenyl)acetyl-CoA isomerase|uniref:enoyl-CoA hydratase/isomerase family protein n=1 Tax=Microbacterium TaxID=33882 RepID=UPI0006FF011B|nr:MULTISPECIES: enoyl-CoA hydratase/isomerase family protein [unclassified Microbacterium]KQR91593.1 enoyl-CoA hydratase [Microbacterium sp. Leaf347]KQR91769.1 enoyl-CoA hydratase [Microbacterium sp. Leaf351]MBN9197940.1 enoyl-CoA hydratase/isomerase family protein [Microbacterium ginsengisoli]OJU79179.1 MAG: enoyl-CoA hydratase [Microbacterium sp. 71-23]
MSDPLLYSVEDGLARLTLNRPERLNAFDDALAYAWADATADATARPDVKAIVVDAAGPAFCAGGDVLAMASGIGSARALDELAHVISRGILSLTESSVPVVAAAHGTTAGGGLGILLASDYAIVGQNSKIGSRYASMGLTPDLSVTAQLARAVGERRALQLVLQERLLPAEEALDWGLVAEVVEPDRVQARAVEVAREWIAGAAGAYGQAKRLVRAGTRRPFADAVADEAASIGAAFDTPEAQARIAAFAAAATRR